jgi:glycosyltransferase involved in cell wall biosynthesis
MAQEGYPADPKTWQQFSAIEQAAMQQARLNIFTTPGAARVYGERYPDAASRIAVIENGYDEDSFSDVNATLKEQLNPGAITLLHSGIVYPSERDPTALFVALGRLKRAGKLRRGEVKLRFRAAVHDGLLNDLAAANEVQELVEVLPPITYRAALQEMLQADALMVMQGSGCNEQIPAKVYEYLRSGRPILGVTDPRGDTATVLRDAGINSICNLASADDIEQQLPTFLDTVRLGRAELPTMAAIRHASRQARTQALASRMEAVL